MRLADVRRLLKRKCRDAGGLRRFGAAHGVSGQYISQVLKGERPPSDRLCIAIGIRHDGERWVREAENG